MQTKRAFDRAEGIFSHAEGFQFKIEGMYFCAGCF